MTRFIISQVVDGTIAARYDSSTVPYGEFRELTKIDPATGYKETLFIGRDHFTRFMGRPGRRVELFNTSNGRYDARKAKYVA